MMIARILSVLLSGAQLIVPPFANDFLRKSRPVHWMGFLLLFAGFSCSAGLTGDSVESLDEHLPGVTPGAYPFVASSSTGLQEDFISNDPWRCGYEVIVVEGPAGELIYSEVPLPCDPTADVYKGCLDEEKALENKQ
jgi:hypothetical protein